MLLWPLRPDRPALAAPWWKAVSRSASPVVNVTFITERLPEISVPTLLICGDEDPSLQPMRVMEKKVKPSRFVLLSPAGHFGNRDQPEAFNRAVLEFLDEVGPA